MSRCRLRRQWRMAKLGPAAMAPERPLVHAAQTGDVNVREQAMRAIAVIQPPETTQALITGSETAADDIRVLASAGWMKVRAIPVPKPSPPLSRRCAILPFRSERTRRTHSPASTPFRSTPSPFSSNHGPTMTRGSGDGECRHGSQALLRQCGLLKSCTSRSEDPLHGASA